MFPILYVNSIQETVNINTPTPQRTKQSLPTQSAMNDCNLSNRPPPPPPPPHSLLFMSNQSALIDLQNLQLNLQPNPPPHTPECPMTAPPPPDPPTPINRLISAMTDL